MTKLASLLARCRSILEEVVDECRYLARIRPPRYVVTARLLPTLPLFGGCRSHIGPHSDTLSNIGPQAIVVGVSLGAKRVFVVQKSLPWGVKKPPAGSGFDEGKKVSECPQRHGYGRTLPFLSCVGIFLVSNVQMQPVASAY